MAITERLSAAPSAGQKLQQRITLGWKSFGIRTKILVPLLLLMSLSLIGSTAGFIISTNTTRNSILDGQLREDAGRVVAALEHREHDVSESTELLAKDPRLINALLAEQGSDRNRAIVMDDRAITVHDRFDLDQVMVFNAEGQTRVNIAPSHLEPLSFDVASILSCEDDTHMALVDTPISGRESVQLLVGCTPILMPEHKADTFDSIEAGASIGTVYTVLDIADTLEDISRNLRLPSDIQPELALDPGTVVSHPHSQEGYRVNQVPVTLAAIPAALTLRLDQQDINQIVNSGLRVMLFSSLMTLAVLLAGGYLLAQSFTHPIRHLANVAQKVADGDLSRRSHLTHNDEIGQLGRSLNHATDTITHLLDQQARTAGELQAILQSMGDGVLAIDIDERIVMINPSAASLLEQDAQRLIGKQLDIILDVENPVLTIGLQQITQQVRSELVDTDLAVTEDRVSLGSRIVRLQSAPTLGSGETLTGAVVLMQDITRAVEADRAKSEFIATASHELRTPLSGLKGFVDVFLISGTDNLNESQHMFLETIKRQTDNMVQMVNDLLEMARLEQGKIRTERRWVNLESSIEEALTSLAALIERRQVAVQMALDADLPSIWIDSLHLRRILTNIISNGIKYVYPGGKVTIHAYELHDPANLPGPPHDDQPWKHKENRSVVVVVEDNGVGIRAEDQHCIFTRFFRSENPLSVEVGGTGLGLAVTRELVLTNNGQIGFHSVEGQGSCFWVRLPAPSSEPLEDVPSAVPADEAVA